MSIIFEVIHNPTGLVSCEYTQQQKGQVAAMGPAARSVCGRN